MQSKGSQKIYIIISILAFLVIIIGATFAYFTAKARSDDSAIDMASHFVQISYTDGKDLQVDDLIPTSDDVAIRSYNGESTYGQCKDDNNRSVCSIYSFEVKNEGTISQYLGAYLDINFNGMQFLKYKLFNTTNDSNKVVVSEGFLPSTVNNPQYSESGKLEPFYIIGNENQLAQQIEANATEKYELVLWLYDNNDVQNYEQGKKLSATVFVSLTDKNHVYGYIEDVNGN